MRKAMWVIFAILFAAFTAPIASADSVTFVCTNDNQAPGGGTPCLVAAPTAPDVTFSSSGTTLDITWNSQTFDLTLPGDWNASDPSFFWLSSNSTFLISDPSHPFDPQPSVGVSDALAGFDDLSEQGTLSFASSGVTTTPEPGTITLILLGIGFVLLTRRRAARGIAPAA